MEILKFLYLLEDKSSRIKSYNLGANEKEVLDYWSKFPQLDNKIDWNKKNISYDDFKKIMDVHKSSQSQMEKSVKTGGISSLSSSDVYEIKTSNENVKAYIPLSHNASKIIASDSVSGVVGKWCTAMNTNHFWYQHTGGQNEAENSVLIYWILPNTKAATQVTPTKLVELRNAKNSLLSMDELSTLLGLSVEEINRVCNEARNSNIRKKIIENNNKPVWISTESEGSVVKEHYVNQVLSNEDGPAKTTTGPGSKTQEEWWINGELHRDDGPALIENSKYGKKETWYTRGKWNRKEKPACISILNIGEKEEWWFQNGKYYRDNGYAYIKTNTKDGTILLQDILFKDGTQVKKEKNESLFKRFKQEMLK